MMKWARRTAVFLVMLVGALCIAMVWTAQRTDQPVGFQLVQTPDGDHHPRTIGVWYPTAARPMLHLVGAGLMDVARDAPAAGHGLPLVVISHGDSGGPTSHTDLALALASAGYIVAAPAHAGTIMPTIARKAPCPGSADAIGNFTLPSTIC